MRVGHLLLLAGIVAVALGGCSSPPAPVAVEQLAIQSSFQPGDGGALAITPTADGMTIAGTFSAPVGCPGELVFTATRSGGTVLVQVQEDATSAPQVCISQVSAYGYEARVSGLPKGAYAVTLQYRVGAGWSTVESAQVVVH